MSATRTQIYLTETQRKRIDEITAAEGVTMAEVIRKALDSYLAREADARAALAATFGADPTVSPPDRSEWDRG
jgi:metal-responsive CopG/Arc/MetJ family transcriptional regulator